MPTWKRALAGLRALARPTQMRAIWQYLPAYWLLRKRLSLLSFRVLRTRHSLGAKGRSSREAAQILLLILRSIGGSFALALVLVVGSALIEFGFKRLID